MLKRDKKNRKPLPHRTKWIKHPITGKLIEVDERKTLPRQIKSEVDKKKALPWGPKGTPKSYESKYRKKGESGGKMNGPSHKNGGIPIEVEGGEYIIQKDSVNKSTEPILNYINKNGKLPKDSEFDFPTYDARKRNKRS